MVYLPSNRHLVTLGSTRNIQSTTLNQCSQSKTLEAVLISNDMARNRHHGWCVSEDTQLLTATKTEPVRANPLGVTLDSNTKKKIHFPMGWWKRKKKTPKNHNKNKKLKQQGVLPLPESCSSLVIFYSLLRDRFRRFMSLLILKNFLYLLTSILLKWWASFASLALIFSFGSLIR